MSSGHREARCDNLGGPVLPKLVRRQVELAVGCEI